MSDALLIFPPTFLSDIPVFEKNIAWSLPVRLPIPSIAFPFLSKNNPIGAI